MGKKTLMMMPVRVTFYFDPDDNDDIPRYERRRSHVLREKKRHGEIEIFVLYLECFEFMLEA